MKKQPSKKHKVSNGQFVGAICLLAFLVFWVGFAALKSIPASISTLTKETQQEECQSLSLMDIGTAEDRTCSKAVEAGAKSAAVFTLATDLVGVVLLVAFGPKLYAVTRQYSQHKK
jgi:hypothetical protein